MGAYDGDIILYTHPTYNHDDVPEGSIDVNEDIRPGTKINVEDTVCNALIAPNGYAYYADDYGHDECARALGMDGVEDAMVKGYIHVAVKYRDISYRNRLTASQKRTLQDMYFTALMNREVNQCRNYILGYIGVATYEGLETE